jgi:hypothetical protein
MMWRSGNTLKVDRPTTTPAAAAAAALEDKQSVVESRVSRSRSAEPQELSDSVNEGSLDSSGSTFVE